MFQWKENFQWIFSNLGSSDKVGVNESGIGIFKRQPYKGLAKEILQNVTDAKNPELPDEVPVRAKFELIYVDLEDIPGHERLREVIHKCSEYYSDGDDGEKLRSIRDAADKYFSGDTKVPVLKISDYNTTGLRGVKEDEDTWVEQSAISVIEYFFYSIYRGKLEVEIQDGEKHVEITQNNLGEMITFYEKYCKEHMADDTAFKFTAPSYWRLLQDSRHKIIKTPFEYNGKSMGNYELYLLTGDDVVEKKVLEMRQAGMKIREDCAFRIPMNFTAIFIATGEGAASQDPKDNISSFLRKCENQAHDDWAADEYKEEKTKAKGIINRVHQIILDAVKAEMPDFGDESVDAFGLSEFLPNEEADDDQKEEKAFSDFRPLTFEIQSVKTGRKRRQADISMKKNGGSKRKKKEEERKRKYHKKSNNKKGTGTGKASEVLISGIRTPFDKATGEYQISFVLDENAEDLVVGIRIGSDDDNLSKANISEATMNGKKLPIKNDMIELKGIHNEGEKNILRVKLEEKTRRTLEVRAYAKH